MREFGPRGRITAGRDAHTHRRHAPLPPLKQIITRFGMWGTAFLPGCWNQIAAVLITLAILGAMVWLYWHGWLWYGALALIVGMLALLRHILSHQLAGIKISAHLFVFCWPCADHP